MKGPAHYQTSPLTPKRSRQTASQSPDDRGKDFKLPKILNKRSVTQIVYDDEARLAALVHLRAKAHKLNMMRNFADSKTQIEKLKEG